MKKYLVELPEDLLNYITENIMDCPYIFHLTSESECENCSACWKKALKPREIKDYEECE